MTNVRITKGTAIISCLDDWKEHARPKGGDAHWKDERSAKELAKAWCGDGTRPVVPPDILALLDSNPAFAGIRELDVAPEAEIKFDSFGGPRNADIAGTGTDQGGQFAITVEAKGDETFDQMVSDVAVKAEAAFADNRRSNALTRVNELMRALFPASADTPDHRENLRYQLLTATAGTLALAHSLGTDRALLVVHEFVTTETRDDLHTRNAGDLDYFVRCLSDDTVRHVPLGEMVGPFHVRPSTLFPQPAALYIGKAVTYKRPSRYPISRA